MKMNLVSARKMFFIRIFGKRIVAIEPSCFGDYGIKSISYRFGNKIYFYKAEKSQNPF
jgi:hypothetical protein